MLLGGKGDAVSIYPKINIPLIRPERGMFAITTLFINNSNGKMPLYLFIH